MKFFDKLKEKLGKRDFRNGLIKIGAVVTIATAAVTFAACNKTGQTPTPTPTPTPGPDTSYTASQILEENTAYKNLNLTNAVFDEIQQNVAKQFNVEKDKVEIVDMHFDKQNANKATVVAKIGGEKVVTASYQNQKIAELRGANKKDLVLEEAGYTADQKVEKDQKATVDAKFTQAVQTILDEIKQIKNITPERVNEIFAGISNIPLPDSLKNNYDFAVVSGVREDGTVVAFTGKDGKLQDHVLSVAGKENMTEKEILDVIASGTGFSQTTRVVDANEKYETPALEEKPVVEYVNFDTVYNEIFGKDYALASPTKLLENALPNIYNRVTSSKLIMYSIDNNNLTLYTEFVDKLGSTGFGSATYKGSNYEKISEYIANYQEMSENFKQYVENKFMPEKIEVGSQEETALKTNIVTFKNDVEAGSSYFEGLTNSDFTKNGIITNTDDVLDQSAFGAKLCEGKEVIATYVGAMSSRSLDDKKMFNTGYYAEFNTAVVYKENDTVTIKKDTIYVPYYNNSTNQSLYNSFLEGEEGKQYKVSSISTEVVNNPVIATENGKKAEYNISFESKDPQLVDIASSAISQWLKNEEDSLSR